MRMVLTWLLGDLTAAIPPTDARPILLLLDDFPLLRAPVIEQKLATMRKYLSSRCCLRRRCLRSARFTVSTNRLPGTCDVTVFFATRDRLTQDYGAALLGQTTKYAESINRDAAWLDVEARFGHDRLARAMRTNVFFNNCTTTAIPAVLQLVEDALGSPL